MLMAVEVDHREVGDHVEMSKEEFERLKATVETLEDQEVLDQLAQSQEDRRKGKVSRWSKVKDRLDLS